MDGSESYSVFARAALVRVWYSRSLGRFKGAAMGRVADGSGVGLGLSECNGRKIR